MVRKPVFVIKYWLCWILFFEVARLFFLLCNYSEAKAAGFSTSMKSLLYGVRMDMSMAVYLTFPVALVILIGIFVKGFTHPRIIKFYTGIVLFFVLLLVGSDINIFKAWGYRIDSSPLKYLRNPTEAWASVSNLPVVWIFFGFVAALVATGYAFSYFIQKNYPLSGEKNEKFSSAMAILVLIGAFIVPMRGGLQLAPLNQSSVYFSENNFANQAAINAPWNFLHSLTHHTESEKNSFVYLDPKEAALIKDSLFVAQNKFEHILTAQASSKPNVIFIVWESFTEKATHAVIDGVPITPHFNELKKEGIYFSNVYASGDRTDKGIVAVLSGYPAQPTTSIVKTPVKANKLPTVSATLASQGYHTSFYYGGELEFANMKAYLLGGHFKKFISKNDFAAKDQNSKWGAHDGVVAQKVIDELKNTPVPFFATWLTLSSHEPFETPVPPVLNGTTDEDLFLNSLHYADQSVYDFISQCKLQPWWSNTLVVITADHGHRLPRTGKKIDDFKMPILILGGALSVTGALNDAVHSQTDIAATVLAQLNLPTKEFAWSRNMLDSSAAPWAYFCFNNGYGFVQPGNYFIFDNVGKKPIEQNGTLNEYDIKKGKAVQQLSFQDFLEK